MLFLKVNDCGVILTTSLNVQSKLKPVLTCVAVVCLALAAAHPFMTGSFPLTADGTLHLYRLIAFDHAAGQGDLWSRYVPGMVFGYGAPFFNYYAPLSLYPLAFFHLAGLSFVDAWLAGMVFYTVVGAGGAYLLAKGWGGRLAGFAAAAAYTYSPYVLYDSVWRGTVAEMAALAALPWCFWGLQRLAEANTRRRFLAAVVCLTLFIPLHNVVTLHSAVLLGVYNVFLWWDRGWRWGVFLRVFGAFGLALGVTAFFWLPALGETGYVKINSITESLPEIDVTRNLMDLGGVFALPITADPTQLQQPVPIALGLPQMAFALAALVFRPGVLGGRRSGGLLLLLGGLLVILVFMTTHASAGIWQVIPLIRYSQFPWRLLGPASLLLALAAGLGVAGIAERVGGRWTAGALTAVMMLYAFGWLYPTYYEPPPANTIVDAQDFERETGWIATSSFGEYLPRWSVELPDAGRLAARYAEGTVIPRLEAPDGVVIEEAAWGLTHGRLRLRAAEPQILVFDWFYFPGWYAVMDGEAAAVYPTEPHGLLAVDIPAGEHTLEVGLGLTGLQSAAVVISVVSGVVVLGVLAMARGRALARRIEGDSWRWAVVVGLGLVCLKVFIVDGSQTLFKRERFKDGAAGVEHWVGANFDNKIRLIGYDLLPEAAASGEQVSLNLYWQLLSEKVETDYSSLVVLRDAAGGEIWRTGSFYPGGLATKNWLPGYYVQERLTVEIPANTPPGRYMLDAALFSAAHGQRLDVINAQGNPEDVKVEIGTVIVERPAFGADAPARALMFGARLDDTLALVGVVALPERADVGEEVALEWYWQAVDKPPGDFMTQFVWLNGAGEAAAESPPLPPVVGYGTGAWQAGDVWRGVHHFFIPGRLEAGRYVLAVRLVGAESLPVPLAEVEVSTPPRRFDVPVMSVVMGAEWANGITLLGYDLDIGDAVRLTLHWQAQNDVNVRLRRFVHLVDAAEHIVTQQDGVPVDWTRPTTGWSPGEVISEVITLPLDGVSKGWYSVRVGWYEAVDGRRVRLDEGDYLVVPEIAIGLEE